MNTYKLLPSVVLLFCTSTTSWADFDTAFTAYNRGDFATAETEFRALAERGDPASQFFLGMMLANGQGIPQDHVEAIKWYHKAAEQGHVDAQAYLGNMYANGQGVPLDIVKACAWWNIASYGGSNFAAMSLVLCESQLSPAERVQALQLAREIVQKYSRK